MAHHSSFHFTPTCDLSHLDQSSLTSSITEDSGYQSNTSGYVTNTSSNTLNQTKLESQLVDNQNTVFTKKIKFPVIKNRFPLSLFHSPFESPILDKSERKYVDFMYYLGERNYYSLVVKKILSYLNDEDLYNSSLVSKIWKQVITSLPSEEKRLRSFIKKIEFTKENRTNSVKKIGYPLSDVNILTPRNTLKQIQNLQENIDSAHSSSASPPSDKANFRFNAFRTEGNKIPLGRRLYSCPKCKLPSHVDINILNTALCTNGSCQYRFCILCECEEHPHKICDFISTPVLRKHKPICTARSKKNLKRLLL